MKRIKLSLLALALASMAVAQAPQRIKYQSVVRGNTGVELVNQNVGLRISVLEGDDTGPVVYAETHAATTNAYGLANLEIGGGTVVSGDFASIDWATSTYFFKVELDATGGTNYQLMGTSQALSVPYSLYAETSGSQLPGPQGPQGPPGTAGPAGATGAAGPPGATGATGPQGPAGADGTGVTILGSFADVSELPSTGNPGDAYLIDGNLFVWSDNTNDWDDVGTIQGPAGPAGATGATGPIGPVGPQGQTGATGATGQQGPAGPQGATGAAGPQGPAGATGATGAQGPQGTTGPQGAPGTPGATGPQGPAGPQGADGADGTGVTILGSFANESQLPSTGTPGDAYLINGDLYVWSATANDWDNVGTIQGPAGTTGATGATGATGPQGPAGPIGVTGAQGPVGAQGPAGSANISGTENRLVKFTGPETGGNSIVYDNGVNVGVGTDTPYGRFQVDGDNSSFRVYDFPEGGDNVALGAEFRGLTFQPALRFAAETTSEFWDIGMNGSDGYRIASSQGEALSITAAGSVGFGTNAPGGAFETRITDGSFAVREWNGGGANVVVTDVVGRNGFAPQQRFSTETGADFIDIGMDAASGFTIERNDIPTVNVALNGNVQMNPTADNLSGNASIGDIVYNDTKFNVTSNQAFAIYAESEAAGNAGYFAGNVDVTGTLSKGGGSFKIDHPLDPANKFLYHSFVESPDMMNVYNGNVVLDGSGAATVTLPDYFQALNKEYRYQLTPIGAPGPGLYVALEVANGVFAIAGGTPGAKVSWQVTGIRQDAFANENRIPNAVDKKGVEVGKYLHPAAFGQDRAMGIDYRTPAAPTGK